MTKYQIYAGAMEPSTYEADTEEAAIVLFVQDAGYTDIAAAADVCSQTAEAFLADLVITVIR
jgi:hypothetical protein